LSERGARHRGDARPGEGGRRNRAKRAGRRPSSRVAYQSPPWIGHTPDRPRKAGSAAATESADQGYHEAGSDGRARRSMRRRGNGGPWRRRLGAAARNCSERPQNVDERASRRP
jgi:hypothetical protein